MQMVSSYKKDMKDKEKVILLQISPFLSNRLIAKNVKI